MKNLIRRRREKTSFERASDGSMTLLEHFQELRSRLFKASLGVVVGFGLGLWLAGPVTGFLQAPYCDLMRQTAAEKLGHPVTADWQCPFIQLGVTDTFVLRMKIALWVGLIVASPIWLYQLWAFIAPGLHRRERRWAYGFVGVATPLFVLGALLAQIVVAKGMSFLFQFNGPNVTTTLEITRYIDFIVGLMLLFGAAFEFPLVVVMFNLAGLASAKRLLSWWRIAVFLTFLFSAVATPTADPFGMSFLALALSALYFAAVGFAFFNDRRRARAAIYGDLSDDEISPLERGDHETTPLERGDHEVGAVTDETSEEHWKPEPAAPLTRPLPLERHYDDVT